MDFLPTSLSFDRIRMRVKIQIDALQAFRVKDDNMMDDKKHGREQDPKHTEKSLMHFLHLFCFIIKKMDEHL